MESSPTERRDFIAYPINRVVGTIADAKTAHATIDALLPLGITHLDMPLTPERVWRAIQEARA